MGFGQAHLSAFAENSARESRSRRPSTSRQPCAMHNVASTKRAIAAQDGPVILGRTLRPRCGDYRSGNAPKALWTVPERPLPDRGRRSIIRSKTRLFCGRRLQP